MKRIGDLSGMLDDLSQRRQQYRAQMIAEHGWQDDVSCVSCGDMGVMPDGRECESCERGRALIANGIREQEWQDMMPRRFRSYTLSSHPRQNFARQVQDWIDQDMPQGTNLILHGGVGSGKTGLAVGAARDIFLRGKPILLRTVPDLMDMLRPLTQGDPSPRTTMTTIQRVPLLVMDDFGVEKETEWVAERLYLIINGRYEQGLPTIVTTNRSMQDMAVYAGARAVSRLQEGAVTIAVTGPDLRAMI